MVAHTYDCEADALYIELADGSVARTEEIDPGTMVDVDATGRPLGIEVLHPARRWPLGEIIRRYAVSSDAAAMLHAMHPNATNGRSGRLSFGTPYQDVSAAAATSVSS
jgi:uncharacterized protein YuzE